MAESAQAKAMELSRRAAFAEQRAKQRKISDVLKQKATAAATAATFALNPLAAGGNQEPLPAPEPTQSQATGTSKAPQSAPAPQISARADSTSPSAGSIPGFQGDTQAAPGPQGRPTPQLPGAKPIAPQANLPAMPPGGGSKLPGLQPGAGASKPGGESGASAMLKSAKQQDSVKASKISSIDDAKEQLREHLRKEVERVAKAGIRRGIMAIMNSLGVTSDTGTAGVSSFVNIPMYIVSLVWYNLEMIYGYYLADKKSYIISPLEWKPLKVPLPDWMLHIALVAVDLAFILVFGTLMLLGLLILMFFVELISDPLGLMANIALGLNEFGPLLGTIKSFIQF